LGSHQPGTNKKEQERGRKIGDYRVLTDAAKDEEQTCKKKPSK